MIQNLTTLASQVDLINQKIQTGGFVQKVQSTPVSFVIRVRVPGESFFVHIGRGKGNEGIWITGQAPEKEIRIKDRFNDWLKKNLIGLKLVKIYQKKDQRILNFELTTKEGREFLGIFYKGRKMYFSFLGEEFTFKSWVGKNEEVSLKEGFEDIFNELISDFQEKVGVLQVIENDELYKGLIQRKENVRRKKLIMKKLEENLKNRERVKRAPLVQSQIAILEEENLRGHFGDIGLKIKKKYGESVHQFRDRAFNKIKNFKKSEIYLDEKYKHLQDELKNISELQVLKKTTYPEWKEIIKKVQKNVIYFELDGAKGAYGKNAKGNDFIRNQFGKSEDVWFHLEGDKSCHLILKRKIELITIEMAEQIGSLINDVMKRSSTEMRLICAPLKDIKGIKNRPGAVTIKNPNYFKVLYNSNWKEIISID